MNTNMLKLYYFNMRGRAELIRLILAFGNRKYDDVRFELRQWSAYKPKMLLGQVPILELPDSTQVPQSLAIARYLARETGLAGQDNLESAKIDAVVDTQREMNDIFYTKLVIDDEGLQKGPDFNNFIDNEYNQHCNKLSKLKKAFSKNGKHFIGNQLSWADLFVYDSMDTIFRFEPKIRNQFDQQFKNFLNTIRYDERLTKYFDERPNTKY